MFFVDVFEVVNRSFVFSCLINIYIQLYATATTPQTAMDVQIYQKDKHFWTTRAYVDMLLSSANCNFNHRQPRNAVFVFFIDVTCA